MADLISPEEDLEERLSRLLSDAPAARAASGPLSVPVDRVISGVAPGARRGGRTRNKPNPFERRDGRF